jgi:hypothetical protein
MLSAILENASQEDSLNTDFNVKVKQILEDVSEMERALILRMSVYNQKTFMFPTWDDVVIPNDLKIDPLTFRQYEFDLNISKRIFALRDLISTDMGVKVVREGIAVKQQRINKLQEGFDRTEELINQRKEHARFLAETREQLTAKLTELDEDSDEYQNTVNKIAYIDQKLIPGVSSGMLKEDGSFDVGLAIEQRKILFDTAKELGDIVARSNNTTTKKVQKVYDDSTKALI